MKEGLWSSTSLPTLSPPSDLLPLVLQVLLKLITHTKIHDLLITINKTCKTVRPATDKNPTTPTMQLGEVQSFPDLVIHSERPGRSTLPTQSSQHETRQGINLIAHLALSKALSTIKLGLVFLRTYRVLRLPRVTSPGATP